MKYSNAGGNRGSFDRNGISVTEETGEKQSHVRDTSLPFRIGTSFFSFLVDFSQLPELLKVFSLFPAGKHSEKETRERVRRYLARNPQSIRSEHGKVSLSSIAVLSGEIELCGFLCVFNGKRF